MWKLDKHATFIQSWIPIFNIILFRIHIDIHTKRQKRSTDRYFFILNPIIVLCALYSYVFDRSLNWNKKCLCELNRLPIYMVFLLTKYSSYKCEETRIWVIVDINNLQAKFIKYNFLSKYLASLTNLHSTRFAE